jgi:hypothetical protein
VSTAACCWCRVAYVLTACVCMCALGPPATGRTRIPRSTSTTKRAPALPPRKPPHRRRGGQMPIAHLRRAGRPCCSCLLPPDGLAQHAAATCRVLTELQPLVCVGPDLDLPGRNRNTRRMFQSINMPVAAAHIRPRHGTTSPHAAAPAAVRVAAAVSPVSSPAPAVAAAVAAAAVPDTFPQGQTT